MYRERVVFTCSLSASSSALIPRRLSRTTRRPPEGPLASAGRPSTDLSSFMATLYLIRSARQPPFLSVLTTYCFLVHYGP